LLVSSLQARGEPDWPICWRKIWLACFTLLVLTDSKPTNACASDSANYRVRAPFHVFVGKSAASRLIDRQSEVRISPHRLVSNRVVGLPFRCWLLGVSWGVKRDG
jgi:hypothetical protein